MRVTSNGKVWRSEAEWRTLCERFTRLLDRFFRFSLIQNAQPIKFLVQPKRFACRYRLWPTRAGLMPLPYRSATHGAEGAYQSSGNYAAHWACVSQYVAQECSRNTQRKVRSALRSVTFQRIPGPLIRAAVSCFPALSMAPEPMK